jgi:hypothetical protein
LSGTFADFVDPNGNGKVNIPVSQQLNTVSITFDESDFDQRDFVNNRLGIEPVQVLHIDNGKGFFKWVFKPTFWQSAVDRHLTALVTGPYAATGTAILSFIAPPAVLPEPDATPRPTRFLAFRWPASGAKSLSLIDYVSSATTRWDTFSTIPLTEGVF